MKILGIGKNYLTDKTQISELKKTPKLIFSKADSSLVINNKNVEFPSFTNNLVYEVELVAKIGREGKNILKEKAESYISEMAIGIDYTAKDVLNTAQESKWPWDFAKGFDGAAPISNFKPISNFPDLANINFDLKINGEQKQTGNTSYMINNFADIIAYISQYMTLKPGDIIFTGTPAKGIGQVFKGDHLQAAIEGEVLLDFKMI